MGIYGSFAKRLIESKVGNQKLEEDEPNHPHQNRIVPPRPNSQQNPPIQHNPEEDEFDKQQRKENK